MNTDEVVLPSSEESNLKWDEQYPGTLPDAMPLPTGKVLNRSLTVLHLIPVSDECWEVSKGVESPRENW